ncbi:MAG: hypothetical protein AB7T06_30815 [Kofleriaceae bacterium]
MLVLLALAFSLGQTRDATQITDEITVLETELDASNDTAPVERVVTRAVPREMRALAENFVLPPRSLDAGRVFRPPRDLAA